jgi:hypothetical protein
MRVVNGLDVGVADAVECDPRGLRSKEDPTDADCQKPDCGRRNDNHPPSISCAFSLQLLGFFPLSFLD